MRDGKDFMENLITLTVNSTHFFLINCRNGNLLVDAGWELQQFTSRLKAYKIPFSDIRYIMFTHHHPDHAGLVQNIKNISGARMIIHERQIPYFENLRRYYEKKGGYEPIRVEKDDLVSPDRGKLASIGIHGEILETPGHSEDSVSLVLDSGLAFIGDLPLPDFASEGNYETTRQSWISLLAREVQVFYHSHTDPIPAARIRELLKE
jgi:glyoxylase-like metal-dependent hydrolase (beta-lactamase superfamily II)